MGLPKAGDFSPTEHQLYEADLLVENLCRLYYGAVTLQRENVQLRFQTGAELNGMYHSKGEFFWEERVRITKKSYLFGNKIEHLPFKLCYRVAMRRSWHDVKEVQLLYITHNHTPQHLAKWVPALQKWIIVKSGKNADFRTSESV